MYLPRLIDNRRGIDGFREIKCAKDLQKAKCVGLVVAPLKASKVRL